MKTKYGSPLIILHWGMLLLIIAVFVSIELRELYPKGTPTREGMKALHFMLGMSVLFLGVLRLVVRFSSGPVPKIEPDPASWMKLSASLTHIALYAVMIVLPISGWVVLSAAGKSIPFGLPALMSANEGLAHTIEEAHEIGGQIALIVILLHSAAALFHHYVLRDNTLRRMLPGSKS